MGEILKVNRVQKFQWDDKKVSTKPLVEEVFRPFTKVKVETERIQKKSHFENNTESINIDLIDQK